MILFDFHFKYLKEAGIQNYYYLLANRFKSLLLSLFYVEGN